ncbi:MAG: protein phosphatase 2C domain-containing protein [Actinomycetota bacterium]
MQLRGATSSHVGNVRESNQDRAHFGGYIAAVADGMGGHQGGEMAASIAISEFLEVVDPIAPGGLRTLVEDANRAVFERAADPELRGMGTTLVALTLRPAEQKISVVNVGDSRAYFVRGGEMGQLTIDHSLVEDLVRQNRLTPAEALTHPQRNILTRALGIASEVEVDQFLVPTRIGDRFLLCSDGLFNEVSEDDILGILTQFAEPNQAADALVAAALQGAGRDNITVCVVDVVDEGGGGNVSSAEPETLQMPAYEPATTLDASGGNGSPPRGNPVEGAGGADPVSAAITTTVTAVGLVEPAGAEQGAPPAGVTLDTQPIAVITEQETPAEPVVTEPAPTQNVPKRKRRVLRFFVTLLAFAVVAAAAAGGLRYWIRQSWFIDAVPGTGELLVVNGRPDTIGELLGNTDGVSTGGVLDTELDPEGRLAVENGEQFESEQDALDFIARHTAAPVDPTDDVGTDEADDPASTSTSTTATTTAPASPDADDVVDGDTLDDLTENAPDSTSDTPTTVESGN